MEAMEILLQVLFQVVVVHRTQLESFGLMLEVMGRQAK
jgi:hypothetical protein